MKVHLTFKRAFPKIKPEKVEKLVEKFLEKFDIIEAEVGIHFVGLKEIQKINKHYRKIDKPTDVISFPIDEPHKKKRKIQYLTILGDIFIAPDYLKGQRLGKVIKHGLIHLLGYDHQTDQEKKKFDSLTK